jgi:hypothetical protein
MIFGLRIAITDPIKIFQCFWNPVPKRNNLNVESFISVISNEQYLAFLKKTYVSPFFVGFGLILLDTIPIETQFPGIAS